MSTQIGPLAWAASQGGAAGSLIAQINLDSSVDTSFVIPAVGLYSGTPGKSIYADGVIIYNSNNNGTVMVSVGPLETDIPPFIRDIIQLSSAQTIMVDFTVGTINLLFYKGTPPVSPTLYNYAGAQAVANATLFIGGMTTGIGNAQAIMTGNSANYSFTNGVLISGTWGFNNTGALTLNVNGVGAVAVNKPSPTGPVACVGGEAIAGADFIVAVNNTTGAFDLVSSIDIGALVSDFLPGQVALNNATYTVGPTVATGGKGTFLVSGTVLFQDGTGLAQVTVKVWDGATYIASGRGNTQGTQGWTFSFAGYITNPSGNVRVEAISNQAATTVFAGNASGFGKDSGIWARRVA